MKTKNNKKQKTRPATFLFDFIFYDVYFSRNLTKKKKVIPYLKKMTAPKGIPDWLWKHINQIYNQNESKLSHTNFLPFYYQWKNPQKICMLRSFVKNENDDYNEFVWQWTLDMHPYPSDIALIMMAKFFVCPPKKFKERATKLLQNAFAAYETGTNWWDFIQQQKDTK